MIIDRCFSFELMDDWDVRIWVETSPDVALLRGTTRDGVAESALLPEWATV